MHNRHRLETEYVSADSRKPGVLALLSCIFLLSLAWPQKSFSQETNGATTSDKELAQEARALDIIEQFAAKMCTDIPLSEHETSTTLSGEGKAQLNGVISRVADLGFKGAAEYKDKASQGVLQSDLVNALKDSRNCKLEIWRDLKSKFLSSP